MAEYFYTFITVFHYFGRIFNRNSAPLLEDGIKGHGKPGGGGGGTIYYYGRTHFQDSTGNGSAAAQGKKRSIQDDDCRSPSPDGDYFPAGRLFEYQWPVGDDTAEHYMLQEQVAEFLDIRGIQRKYPGRKVQTKCMHAFHPMGCAYKIDDLKRRTFISSSLEQAIGRSNHPCDGHERGWMEKQGGR